MLHFRVMLDRAPLPLSSTELPALERELDRLLVEYGVLDEACWKAANVTARRRIGKEADRAVAECHCIHEAIVAAGHQRAFCITSAPP